MKKLDSWVNKIHCGDCSILMKEIPENSIDCIVTDPPYGISFMGKKWDKALPKKEAFQQMFKVLKPGALAFVMSSPRQDVLWRMMKILEDVGFELKQSFISWIYKTGFPKAYDVSLGIDKKIIRKEFIVKYGRKPTKEEIKKLVKEKRKVVGEGKGTSLNYQNKINTEQGFRPSDYYEEKNGTFDITEASSDLAKKWEGWKSITGLKPALECILMVNKPMSERTIVDNVLVHGVGAVNVDACRIPFQSVDDKEQAIPQGRITTRVGAFAGRTQEGTDKELDREEWKNKMKGRFPANLLASDGALDNDVGGQSRYFDLDAWAKEYNVDLKEIDRQNKILGLLWNKFFEAHTVDGVCEVDVGYFWDCMHDTIKMLRPDLHDLSVLLDVPKASKSERNMGLDKITPQIRGSSNPLWMGGAKCAFKTGSGNERKKLLKNFHPTVKPVKLMAYLVELGCPPDGIVLDPFVGSGTTCKAAKKLNRKWIGIELNAEYAKIASARLDDAEIIAHKIITQEIVKTETKEQSENICTKPNIKCAWRSFDGIHCLSKKGCIK